MTLDHYAVVAMVIAAMERGEDCPDRTAGPIRAAMSDERWEPPVRYRERRHAVRATASRASRAAASG